MFILTDKLKIILLQFACLGLTIWVAYESHRANKAELEQAISETARATNQINAAMKVNDLLAILRKTEDNLNERIQHEQEEDHAKTTIVYRDSTTLLNRLRIAEANSAKYSRELELSKPKDSTNSEGGQVIAYGELLNQYGEEDVQEAKRADLIRIGLEACYRQYDEVREAINALPDSTVP